MPGRSTTNDARSKHDEDCGESFGGNAVNENLIGGIIILFLIFVLYNKVNKKIKKVKRKLGIPTSKPSRSKKQTASYTPMSHDEIRNAAEEAADKIKTHIRIEAAEERLDTLHEKLDEAESETTIDKLKDKARILEEAIDIASNKPFRYYIESLDVNITAPKEIFKFIGKAITPKKYEELDNTLKQYFDEITFSDVNDVEEAVEIAKSEVDDRVKEIIAFRKIVDDEKLSEEHKIKKLDNFMKTSNVLVDEFDDPDDFGNYYYQYLRLRDIKELENFGIKKAGYFVDNGYSTIEEVINVPPEKIIEWHGIGEATLKAITDSQRLAKSKLYQLQGA